MMMTLSLQDPTLYDLSSLSSTGYRVRVFAHDPARFPKITKVGDIVILRDIKVGSWTGSRMD